LNSSGSGEAVDGGRFLPVRARGGGDGPVPHGAVRGRQAVNTVKAVAKAMHGECDMASIDMVETSEALVAMLR
jgi:hypothetical protein